MKKVILFALLVATVFGSTAIAQNQKTNSAQPVKSLTTTSYAPAAKEEPAKKEVNADKKDVKKETSKAKKETKQSATPAK
jgi:hypothetical protein